jgi:hypothetical protein
VCIQPVLHPNGSYLLALVDALNGTLNKSQQEAAMV